MAGPYLTQLRTELVAIEEDAVRLLTGMHEEQFRWRPSPGEWSIAECLSHLNVVDNTDVRLISRAVNAARLKGWTGSEPARLPWLSSWLIGRIGPPVKLKTKAPKIYVPPPDTPLEKVRSDFQSIHERLLEVIDLAEGLDLARVTIAVPFNRFIRFSFIQRLRLIAAHDRRHLWQAWQVSKRVGFPT